MWRLPSPLIATNGDATARRRLIQHLQEQLRTPEYFVDGIEERYAEPESDSFDILNFKDGRVLERYSIPLRLDGRSVGRVWSFRDVTARRRAECVQEAV
jgi:PAS domain-containing protein